MKQLIKLVVLGTWCSQLAVAEEAVTELESIQVRGETSGLEYVVPNTFSATKSDMPILETPMSVQAVSREIVDDRRANTAIEALMNVSGVQKQQGTFYDQFQIRGFGSGYGVSYRNGLELEGIEKGVNMSFVDRIEVIKGPASMLYGRVEPGGFVNVVTKKPEFETKISLEQRAASWNNYRTVFDATGALNDSKTAAYRVIADYDKGDNFFDYDHHENKAILASFALKPSDDLDLNFDIERYENMGAGRGANTAVPVVGNRPDSSIPRSLSGSDPVIWDSFPDTVRRTLFAFDWTYHFNDQWKVTQRFHFIDVDERQTGIGDWGTGTWNFIYNPLTRKIYNTNLDLSGELFTGSVRHKVLVGVDYFRYTDDWKGFVGDTLVPLSNRNLLATLNALKFASRDNTLWKTVNAGYGMYFQDTADLTEKWKLLLGGRYSSAYEDYALVYGNSSSACYPNCTGQMGHWPSDSEFAPRAALLYKVSDSLSVYGSYAKSFGTNNSSFLSSGQKAAPEMGEQYELGTKKSFLEDRVMASATIFHLVKSNVLGIDPTDPFGIRQIPIGEVTSKGLELDLAGQVTSHINLIASYTLNSVIITKDTNSPSNEGKRRNGTPLNSASLWAKYDTAPKAPDGWELGFGAYLNGQRQGDDANTWQLPGYAKFDVMAGYRTQLNGHKLTAQFNVKNIFDRKYFDDIGFGTAAYGEPRAFTGTVKLEY